MDWAKKDTSTQQAQSDLRACEEAAFREANAVPYPYPTMGPAVLQPPSERRFNTSSIGPFADPHGERYMRESRLTGECMREKGYELAPAEPKKN
jgi:hypothetical protein